MTLFLKVFLWFWLAMALVVGAFFLATELSRSREQFPRGSITDKYTAFIAQTAALTYERDGQTGLVQYLQRMERETGHRPRLFNEQGEELSGLGAQPGAPELVRRVLQSAAPMFSPPGEKFLVAFPALTSSGHTYVFVTEVAAPFSRPPLDPRLFLPRILAVLLTAGVLCYLLTLYIVSPVVKLRTVTRQVSEGDLSARVGPLLGRRRDELAAMGRDFDAMATKIETLMTSQQRLLRDISHELRSPLARLNVALDLARRRCAGDRATVPLERIEREALRINEMIGQLLTLVRWENNADGLQQEVIDLASLVTEVAADADFEARSQNRQVRVLSCDDCWTMGKHSLLRSAIENVLRNAVRYTEENTSVDVSLKADNGRAVITVRDHGPGVPEETLSDIFRPFYRVEEARDPDSGGTGLGLAITARAISLHHGTVAAANARDGGFIVEINLPII
jgi:two-component system sensor histidine kinase CpxA